MIPNLEMERMKYLLTKLKERTIDTKELEELVNIIKTNGAPFNYEINSILNTYGFNSINDLERELQERKNKDFFAALATVGLAILVGYALKKMSE